MNTDLQLEYARQREHLERNLATIKKKVVKESELHRTDYVRIMQVLTYIPLSERLSCQRWKVSHDPSESSTPGAPQLSKGLTSFPYGFLSAPIL